MLAYVHNWSPTLIEIGSLAIRWYGLSYLFGFIAGIALLRFFAEKNLSLLKKSQVSDYITLCALIGVMLGGRLGYALFYQPSLLQFSADFPWWGVLQVWDGGMASHGGILGVTLFTFWYGWKHKIPAVHIGDNLVVAAPIGLALGRFANFINGELVGKVASKDLPWAVQFPKAPLAELSSDSNAISQIRSICEEAQQLDHISYPENTNNLLDFYEHLILQARTNPKLEAIFAEHLHYRHPSQLYEMLVEGVLLFLILFTVRLKAGKKLAYGILTGLFFALYALGRIAVENYRVPDAELILNLSRGQFYSLFMLFASALFFLYAAKFGKKQAQQQNS